jgi:curved DNA-binding protein CbpA
MNYYELLGVSPSDDLETIRTEYRKLTRRYHPDSTSEEAKNIPVEVKEEKIRQLNEAFDVIKDPDARRNYDRMLQQGSNATTNARTGTGSQQQNRQSPPPPSRRPNAAMEFP